jgi:threonine synthase
MDILISSNLERLLFLATGGDAARVAGWMKELQETGVYRVDDETLAAIQAVFSAGCCDEEESAETIGRTWRDFGYLCDPHTAVALHAARQYREKEESGRQLVVLSTASPFKFPAAVLAALGEKSEGDAFEQMEKLARISGLAVPQALAGLREREILHHDVIEKSEIAEYVKKKVQN